MVEILNRELLILRHIDLMHLCCLEHALLSLEDGSYEGELGPAIRWKVEAHYKEGVIKEPELTLVSEVPIEVDLAPKAREQLLALDVGDALLDAPNHDPPWLH